MLGSITCAPGKQINYYGFSKHSSYRRYSNYLPFVRTDLVMVGAGFGALVSGCSTVELPSKQALPQATTGARARAPDDEPAGVGARLPSSPSSSLTSQLGPKSRCHLTEPENASRHLYNLDPTRLGLLCLALLDSAPIGLCSLDLILSIRVQRVTLRVQRYHYVQMNQVNRSVCH